ncbi:MAG: TetR/AcrR family transcriptional regulator [Conexibacter sp.]|jgi:TetR/AcrR family transcriptional regulator of autoinduction and epiphytic fitness|nr:TetR/AcrR family transcriptional regulator [Conexibacter sp.]
MLESAEVTPRDGRTARSHRTRGAIVDALVALLEAGRVQPTIEEIAARASVAPRTVFQHFADRDALFAAVSEQRTGQLDELMGTIDAGGRLEQRVAEVVAQRARVFEWIAPVRRAALLMEPFSDSARQALEGFRSAKRGEVARVFAAEIAAAPESERATLTAALSAAASWSCWAALREQQGLDVEQASAALHRTLLALLTAGPPARS